MQQPAVKAVAIKSEAQQAVLALHRMRSQLVKFRTAQINGLRGLLAEYGEVMPQGCAGITKGIVVALAKLVDRLPAVLLDTLREQWARVGQLNEQVAEIERRLRAWHKEDKASCRIAEIPGVGLLTATAAVAAMGEPRNFKSGREFAAWLGLVPSQYSPGGKTRLGHITKVGDAYMRSLLVPGARSVLNAARNKTDSISRWAVALAERRGYWRAIVAIAAKNARMAWASLSLGGRFAMPA